MRRFVVSAVAFVALIAPASAWAANVTLSGDHRVARYDDHVRFKGTVLTPEPQQVSLLRDGVVIATTTAAAGAFVFDLRAHRPGSYVARSVIGDSGAVVMRLQPRLRSRLVGRRRIGHRVLVVGRLLPAAAGRLLLGRTPVRVRADGRFRVRVRTASGPRIVRKLRLRPRPGYVSVARRVRLQLLLPLLQTGSHGPAVFALKQRLWELHYLLPSIDSGFGYRTYEAVLAFQKVHWMPRTGQVDLAFWHALLRGGAPQPRVRHGDYIEVDKSRQVVMEVRDGKVTGVIHASTGATGNTPAGTWHVYSEVAGWSWVLWQPMYFLRGFAIHGYPEVPPWPASHGCVRVPMWLATGLRERWGYGTTVRVYA